jgi:hypothetical protein
MLSACFYAEPRLKWVDLCVLSPHAFMACTDSALALTGVRSSTLQLAVKFLHHMCSIRFSVVKTVMNFKLSVEWVLSLCCSLRAASEIWYSLITTFILVDYVIVCFLQGNWAWWKSCIWQFFTWCLDLATMILSKSIARNGGFKTLHYRCTPTQCGALYAQHQITVTACNGLMPVWLNLVFCSSHWA